MDTGTWPPALEQVNDFSYAVSVSLKKHRKKEKKGLERICRGATREAASQQPKRGKRDGDACGGDGGGPSNLKTLGSVSGASVRFKHARHKSNMKMSTMTERAKNRPATHALSSFPS